MRLFTIVVFLVGAFLQVFAQSEVLVEKGERLVTLRVNPTLLKAKGNKNNQLQKKPGPSQYFILDTLTLPFIDDFSSNWMKDYDTANYTLLKIDSISSSFSADAIFVNTLICSIDTTFTYMYDTLDSSTTKTPLAIYQIVNYNDPNNPFVPSDTTYCWEPYFVFDTINFPSPDTCFADTCAVIDSLILMALVNQFDTIAVYLPDTNGAGLSMSRWIDDLAFINNTYPIDPITIGVATLDGLDETGTPHNNFTDPGGYGIADYLTSKPIDLTFTPTDSVFFSFYYQPEGLGNKPQNEDSLVLEFYAPEKRTWYNIWSTPGKPQQDFKQVMIHIINSDYLKIGFQFRFKNYATISGNFDHWHIDYVRLDNSRGIYDTLIVDVAFVYDAPSLLKNYRAIPWKHFLKDTINQLEINLQMTATNNDSITKTTDYLFVLNNLFDSVLLDSVKGSGVQLGAVSQVGYTSIPSALTYNCYSPVNNCFSPSSDSAVFELINVLTTTPDDNRGNDTLRNYQRFYNYYAYDDGSAESAYDLVGNSPKLAYKFTTITPDTIRAIDIFFAQSVEDVSSEFFYLTIWSSIVPENIIYQRQFVTPEYEDSLNEFHTYLLDEILVLSGTYYIGFVQEDNIKMHLGFDLNTIANTNLYYNTTGTWLQSILPGAVMMRPLFGDTVIIPAGISEEDIDLAQEWEDEYLVYPNPARDIIYFEQSGRKPASSFDSTIEMRIVDLYGRNIMTIPYHKNSADVSNLSEGIYFFEFRNVNSGKTTAKKILITR